MEKSRKNEKKTKSIKKIKIIIRVLLTPCLVSKKKKKEKERPATTIPRKNSLITYKVVTEAKCNSHETISLIVQAIV